MPVRHIVRGQRVDEAKVERAKELRRRMTPAEQTLWQALRRGQLHGLRFRRQQVIAGFIVDFYCHRAGLVIEVDGEAHVGQGDYDEERGQVLASLGLRELRFTNDEVETDLSGVLCRISEACGGGEPNPPGPVGNLTPQPPSLRRKGEPDPLPSPIRRGAGGEVPLRKEGGAGPRLSYQERGWGRGLSEKEGGAGSPLSA